MHIMGGEREEEGEEEGEGEKETNRKKVSEDKKTHAFCYSGPSLSGQAWPSGWTQSTPYQSR